MTPDYKDEAKRAVTTAVERACNAAYCAGHDAGYRLGFSHGERVGAAGGEGQRPVVYRRGPGDGPGDVSLGPVFQPTEPYPRGDDLRSARARAGWPDPTVEGLDVHKPPVLRSASVGHAYGDPYGRLRDAGQAGPDNQVVGGGGQPGGGQVGAVPQAPEIRAPGQAPTDGQLSLGFDLEGVDPEC